MANITYHKFDENGQYTHSFSSPEENLEFEDLTKIYVGTFDDSNKNVNDYYHDFNTNSPVLKPENPNPLEYKEFDYVTKQWKILENNITTELKWQDVRSARTFLIAKTDWTQLPDVPLATKEAWATYRQALRDITSQSDPFNITWPTKPE